MAVPTSVWSETSPAGSDNISAGDNAIRLLKTQIREVVAVDHEFTSTQTASTGGQHKQVTLQEQANLGTGAVSATILGSQTISGKGELVYTDEDDNDIQITNAGKLFLGTIYPVGIVVTLGVSTNPATLFGVGTWTAIEGKVIVGISDEVGDEAFDTLNETGGAQTVTLTSAQSGVPAHTHPENYVTSSGGALTVLAANDAGNDNLSASWGINTDANTTANAAESHTNLQPYIVKYVWERTA